MATKIYNIVLGCNNLFPVAGAIIADSFLGSFPVVIISAFVSLLVINLGYLFIYFELSIFHFCPFGTLNYFSFYF
jgi:peptide/histidine transporter 3/4